MTLPLAYSKQRWRLLVFVAVACVWIGRRVLRSQPQIGVRTEHAVARSGLARRDVLIVMGILCWWRGAALQRRGRAPAMAIGLVLSQWLMLGGGGFATL